VAGSTGVAAPAADAVAGMARDYETLRRAVVDGEVHSARLGRALIERSGMVAWMEAWSACPAQPPSPPPVPVDAAGSSEAVRILAAMALALVGAGR
jgi:hypothetical protein